MYTILEGLATREVSYIVRSGSFGVEPHTNNLLYIYTDDNWCINISKLVVQYAPKTYKQALVMAKDLNNSGCKLVFGSDTAQFYFLRTLKDSYYAVNNLT